MMMKDTSDRAGSSINSKTTSPPAAMPRFYDSDTEEGAGSLGTFLDVCVFVGWLEVFFGLFLVDEVLVGWRGYFIQQSTVYYIIYT